MSRILSLFKKGGGQKVPTKRFIVISFALNMYKYETFWNRFICLQQNIEMFRPGPALKFKNTKLSKFVASKLCQTRLLESRDSWSEKE